MTDDLKPSDVPQPKSGQEVARWPIGRATRALVARLGLKGTAAAVGVHEMDLTRLMEKGPSPDLTDIEAAVRSLLARLVSSGDATMARVASAEVVEIRSP